MPCRCIQPALRVEPDIHGLAVARADERELLRETCGLQLGQMLGEPCWRAPDIGSRLGIVHAPARREVEAMLAHLLRLQPVEHPLAERHAAFQVLGAIHPAGIFRQFVSG